MSTACFITERTWVRKVELRAGQMEPFAHDLSLTASAPPFVRCFFRVPLLDADYLAGFTATCVDPIIGAISLHIDDHELASTNHPEKWKAVSCMRLERFPRATPLGCRKAPWEVKVAVDVIDINKATKVVVAMEQYLLEKGHQHENFFDREIMPAAYPDLGAYFSSAGKMLPYSTVPLRRTVPEGHSRFVAIPDMRHGEFYIPRSVIGLSSVVVRLPKSETEELKLKEPTSPKELRRGDWVWEDPMAPVLDITGCLMCRAEKSGSEWRFTMPPVPMTIMGYHQMRILKNSTTTSDSIYRGHTEIEFDNGPVNIPVDGRIPFSAKAYIELTPSVCFKDAE